MHCAIVRVALTLSVLVLSGCSPLAQSQPPADPVAPAAQTTATPRASTPGVSPGNGTAAAKPTAGPASAAKPPAAPSPASIAAQAKPTAPTAAQKPAGKPASGTPAAAGSPPAVVATAVAGLPALGASPATKPAANGKPTTGDALGVAASAGAAAAATTLDAEATALCGPGAIISTRAGQVAGRTATVAIPKVYGAYQPNVRGQPTYLNDAPVPNHIFTAVIWGDNRHQFASPPEGVWQGKALCVTGPVELVQQRPQITVASPGQLRAAQ